MSRVKIAVLDSDGDANIYSVPEEVVEKIRSASLTGEDWKKAKFLGSAETFNEGLVSFHE